ncbi:hypothetical protein TVAG_139550 [Trichomonas vaginalis G3]|uniref:SMP-LTD domain-containing protein n=1 Tax=Trichomonas vaginalis (strain ATCC PRA-98 / G3) TaxID=412133 RepID=A2EJ22_TRIV3|nr:hypothetical protein TVAGG3_0609700 [Trichomonas vaginalis G3]EAY07325.1 hypothetical protein TVAG_139550 [Trichomonas vaginalis G3]KAI5524498.1 hypothetical protein TVAGG3_0609700 [Trichomonas vaginalis G3]|eukprot:XP_001319548.1 hypothetical protein [Trichomonas vaginalis G3]
MELQSKPVTESTDWLNFSIERFMEIVDSPEGLEKLSNAISNAMAPNYFKLNSIGSNPIISHISTLKMKEADDIRIAVPITLDIGPSFDVGFNCKNLILKIDVIKLKTTLLLTWLGNSDTCIELTFVDGFDIDFYLSVKLFHFLTFTLSEIPILGAIIKALGTLFIQRQVIKINLPKPVTRESLQQFY